MRSPWARRIWQARRAWHSPSALRDSPACTPPSPTSASPTSSNSSWPGATNRPTPPACCAHLSRALAEITAHKVDDADGSDDDTLDSLTWYDRLGRVVKVKAASELRKTHYDRMGRVTDEYVLAAGAPKFVVV